MRFRDNSIRGGVELELERQLTVWECAIAHLWSEREDHKIIKNFINGVLAPTLNDNLTKEFKHDDSL